MLRLVGMASRSLNDPRAAPAMCAHTASNALRSRSSALKPSWRNCRRYRPLWDAPKTYADRPRRRHLGAQQGRGDVEFPSNPDEGVSLAHQETIAEICCGRRIGRACGAVEAPEQPLPTTVRDLEEEHAIAAVRVDGADHVQI